MSAPRQRRSTTELAEVAYRELRLSALSHADAARLGRLWRGLRLLDDDRAEGLENLEGLLAVYDREGAVAPLVAGLRAILARADKLTERERPSSRKVSVRVALPTGTALHWGRCPINRCAVLACPSCGVRVGECQIVEGSDVCLACDAQLPDAPPKGARP